MKIETMDKGFDEMTAEEQRQEIIRLRDTCLEEVASAQRIMAGYAERANLYTKMLQEMDSKRKGVKSNGQQTHPYSAFDDGDDWD